MKKRNIVATYPLEILAASPPYDKPPYSDLDID